MSEKLNEEFIFQILSIVEEIPEGYVATYGQGVTLKSNGCVDLKKHQWRLND